jgi:hypothetical protein
MPVAIVVVFTLIFGVVSLVCLAEKMLGGESHQKAFWISFPSFLFVLFWMCVSYNANKDYEYQTSSIEFIDGTATGKTFENELVNINKELGVNLPRIDATTKVFVSKRIKNNVRLGIWWHEEKCKIQYAIVDRGSFYKFEEITKWKK